MGERVRCPHCRHRFFIHGYEELEQCYECHALFNPQRNTVEGQ